MSLLIVERGMEGFERGRNLDKLGQKSQDTAELFFNDVHVPVENLLGDEGMGFNHLVTGLPRERLSIAMVGVASAQAALGWTVDYCKERQAFGQSIGSFQNSKFKLAECKTEIDIGEAFIDKCVLGLNEGTQTAEEAAEAKWWCTEMQKRVVDTCLQLHGGLRLHDGVPHRPRLQGCTHPDDLRRHDRDHERDHRPQYGVLGFGSSDSSSPRVARLRHTTPAEGATRWT